MKRKSRSRDVPCRTVARHVLDELDAQLSQRRFASIKLHLKHCPNCSAYLDSLKKTLQLYRAYPIPSHTPLRVHLHFRAAR